MATQMQKKQCFELRLVEAWMDEEGDWVWDDSYPIVNFYVKEGANEKRAFLKAFHKLDKLASELPRGTYVVVSIEDMLEIQDRKTKKPLYIAVPMGWKYFSS